MASIDAPSPATCQSSFEQGVALALHLWPALTLAVQNGWGGPDSEDKRDWFAGAVVDLFPDLSKTSSPTTTTTALTNGAPPPTNDEPDQADVETVLLQVMLDEFEVNVDDESAFEVAEQIVRVREECSRGKLDGELAVLRRRFDARKGQKVAGLFKKGQDQDDETDWDTDDSSSVGDDEDGDVAMDDVPPPRRENEKPEVDEDGFTKVTRKKR